MGVYVWLIYPKHDFAVKMYHYLSVMLLLNSNITDTNIIDRLYYRVTDEALLAETTRYDPPSFLWMFSLLLKDLISGFIFL